MRIRTLGVLAGLAGILCSTAFADDRVDYRGHKVARVYVANEDELATMLLLTDDVWSHGVGIGPVDIRVTPEQFTQLEASGLDFDLLIEDVQDGIDGERGVGQRGEPFTDYLNLDDVNKFIDDLVDQRPDLAEIFVVGKSIEGREIRGIRISGGGGENKPAILFHAAIHAREWITVPVVLWIADKLINEYDTVPETRALVDRCEWLLVPVFNVDGYAYTWSKDRMWRKNRRKNDNGTYGVDNNRNWGYQWGSDNGSSGNPGDATYRGKSAFSEPETKAMADLISNTPNLVAYCDIHSYSELVMWPWGYTNELPPDQDEYEFIGSNMVNIIKSVHGLTYDYGPVYSTIYPVSGASIDWVYGDQNKNAFTCELRDTGEFGFTLPANQIIPQCEEIVPALLFYADWRSTPVRMTLVNALPEAVLPGKPAEILFKIVDGRETLDESSPTLHFRSGGEGEFAEYVLESRGSSIYAAILPARYCGPDSEFFVAAKSVEGDEITSPVGAPDKFYAVAIGERITKWSDDFENDKSWTVKSENLDTGAWERVNPNGTYRRGVPVQPEDDNPAGSGTKCFITQQSPPGSDPSSYDVDGGPTRLISPVLDATTGALAKVTYYSWIYTSATQFGGEDSIFVDVSNDDGATWVPVAQHEHNPAWTRHEFRIAEYVSPTNTVRVRFSVADNPNDATTECGIDDVVLSVLTCENVPLPGDMDCDRDVNFNDIDGFVLALTSQEDYESQNPDCVYLNADANGDGAVNFNDIDAFVELLL